MARAIVLTSGKGGVGKTTLAVCAGRTLAARGYKVVLVDTDVGLNNLDVLTGAENKVVFDLADVIENRCRVRQALIEDEEVEGLFVLPSAHGYDRGRLTAQALRGVVLALKEVSDFVFLDCPAGIELGFHRAVAAADEAIVVTTPHLSALRDAARVIKLLASYDLNSVTAVLNRVRGDLEYEGDSVSADDLDELLGVPVLGAVPDDDAFNLMSAVGQAPRTRGEGSVAVGLMCDRLLRGEGEIYDAKRRYGGFFGSIRRRLRRII